ncbi:MAG: hypothetical protein ABIH46_01400 [Chloroflexota bacterium]
MERPMSPQEVEDLLYPNVGLTSSGLSFAKATWPKIGLSHKQGISAARIAIAAARLESAYLADTRHLAEATHYVTAGGLEAARDAALAAHAEDAVTRIDELKRELVREWPLPDLEDIEEGLPPHYKPSPWR